jgi:hypothetical protein
MGIKTARRTNKAFKIAYLADLGRIYYTATMDAFVHRWALIVLGLLIPSAYTVLEFFAALHRASKNGYIGSAVAYSLLAPRIAKATRRKCSVRTLERGLAALKRLGLVRLTYWTIPDQIVRHGEHSIKLDGTQRVLTQDGWKTLQIRIVTLTERAISLWDRRTCKSGSEVIPHFRQFLTSAKLAANSQIDMVDKPTNIDRQLSEHGPTRTTRQTVSDNVPSPLSTTVQPSRAVKEGCPTSPVEQLDKLTIAQPDVEQRPSTVDVSPQDTAPLSSTLIKSQKETRISDKSSDYTVQSVCEAVTTKFDSEHLSGTNKTRPGVPPDCLSLDSTVDSGPFRGVGHTPPKLPKHAKSKATWPVARAYILVELHRVLDRFSRREADAIYERARYELSGDFPAGWPTCVDWAYWVGRFATMGPPQRNFHMRRDILPLLRTKLSPVPNEPKRYSEFGNDANKPDKKLKPFLKGLFDRFCKD